MNIILSQELKGFTTWQFCGILIDFAIAIVVESVAALVAQLGRAFHAHRVVLNAALDSALLAPIEIVPVASLAQVQVFVDVAIAVVVSIVADLVGRFAVRRRAVVPRVLAGVGACAAAVLERHLRVGFVRTAAAIAVGGTAPPIPERCDAVLPSIFSIFGVTRPIGLAAVGDVSIVAAPRSRPDYDRQHYP